MELKWILATVCWCLLLTLSSSASRVREARQAESTPEIRDLITGRRNGGVCDPAIDARKCASIVFTASRSIISATRLICNFVPTLYTDGSSGQERPDLAQDTDGRVRAALEVPEIYCTAPNLPYNDLPMRSTAVQYQIRLRYTNQATLTQPYTLVIYHVPCVEKDDSSGQPTYNVKATFCVIDGACVGEGKAKDNNPAQTCVSSDDKFAWTGPELTTPSERPTVGKTTTEGKQPTPKQTTKVTAPGPETTTRLPTAGNTPTPPNGHGHMTEKATGKVNRAGLGIDMVALLGSIIVLQIILIIIVVMAIAYVKVTNS